MLWRAQWRRPQPFRRVPGRLSSRSCRMGTRQACRKRESATTCAAAAGRQRCAFAVPDRGGTQLSRDDLWDNRALQHELASSGGKSKILNFRGATFGLPVRRSDPFWARATKSRLFVSFSYQGEPECPFDVSTCNVVLYLSLTTVEETDVRRCRKNGSPQAVAHRRTGCRRDSGGAARGMLLAAFPAAAPAGCRSGPAAGAATGSGCPRLTGGTVETQGSGPRSG